MSLPVRLLHQVRRRRSGNDHQPPQQVNPPRPAGLSPKAHVRGHPQSVKVLQGGLYIIPEPIGCVCIHSKLALMTTVWEPHVVVGPCWRAVDRHAYLQRLTQLGARVTYPPTHRQVVPL